MPIRVNLPNGDVANFPDGMAPADIEKALASHESSVDRGGLRHPLTSVLAPELASVRSGLDAATATPAGQPILARSRTGTLYPSETGTGALNAAKNITRGAGDALLSQAEGLTSPVGMAAGVASALPMKQIASGTLRTVGESLQSPKSLTRQVKTMAGKVATNLADRISPSTDVPSALPLPSPEPPPPTAGLSSVDRAQLAKQGYAPDVIAKIEQAAQQQPATGRLALNPDLQQPRVAVGAEKVGREMGLTKEAVRQQTAPILGEQPGDASPIFPQETLGKIVDAVKALPSSEREAYVARATSGKAQWQIENIRRTLEHLGLLVPVAAGIGPAVKARLESLMHSGTK